MTAPLPPTSPGDRATPETRLGEAQTGDGAVSAAYQERKQRLAGDEAQLRLPPAEQPHGRAIQT